MVEPGVTALLLASQITELRQFLTQGFGEPSDAEWFSEDVLRWKYFWHAQPSEVSRDSLVTLMDGRITGHIGLCRRSIMQAGSPDVEIPAAHTIDWLASAKDALCGIRLLDAAYREVATHYGIGGSVWSKKVHKAMRTEIFGAVQEHRKVVHPLFPLLCPSRPLHRRLASAGKAAFLMQRFRCKRPCLRLTLERVSAFGSEVEEVVRNTPGPMLFSKRDAATLNYFLQYPRGTMTGWRLRDDSPRLRGFAILNQRIEEGVKCGRIVDCFIDSRDPALWHAAFTELSQRLTEGGVDIIRSYSSTPWVAAALRDSGFHPVREAEVTLRDPQRLVPRGIPWMLSMMEGDHAIL